MVKGEVGFSIAERLNNELPSGGTLGPSDIILDKDGAVYLCMRE